MGIVKSLTGQTAYYGISSMLGRLLNYLLVPLWTRLIVPPDNLAIVHVLYAWAALLNVLLTYGMETAFFRFSTDPSCDRKKVGDTAFTALLTTTTVAMVLGLLFFRQIAGAIDYGTQARCLFYFVLIVAFDTYAVIPFARLRLENRALRYAVIKLAGIALTAAMNLLLICVLPHYGVMQIDVESVFLGNAVGSALVLVLLGKDLWGFSIRIDRALLRRMLSYGWPILIGGTAYVVNEVMDRVFLRELLPQDTAEYTLGVYGACFKLAIFITLFVQAFRLAVEPFFFSHAKDRDARQTYAAVTLYFTIAVAAMYIGVMANLSWLQLIIGEQYRSGIDIVPIVLFANVFLGLYYNLSMWYKLTDRTRWGAYISILGAVVTVSVIFYGVPRYGYMAAAWSHLLTYGTMMLVSYGFGQHFYPIPYRVGRIVMYLLLAWGGGYLAWYVCGGNPWIEKAILLVFCTLVYLLERKDFRKTMA